MAIDCQQTVDLLVEYIDGDLEEQKAQRLEHHLDGCPSCVEFVESYRKTGVLCRKALAVEMPQQVKSRLFEFLRDELQSQTL